MARADGLGILAAVRIDATLDAAKAAGAALAALDDVEAALTIDAIVMATAALQSGVVITSDPDDLARLASIFPGVTVLST